MRRARPAATAPEHKRMPRHENTRIDPPPHTRWSSPDWLAAMRLGALERSEEPRPIRAESGGTERTHWSVQDGEARCAAVKPDGDEARSVSAPMTRPRIQLLFDVSLTCNPDA
jgi:hypothetical protein